MPLVLKISYLALGGFAVLGALAYYYLYAPAPPMPPLSAPLRAGHLLVDGRLRTYWMYLPAHLPPHAPVLFVLHGSNQTGQQIRRYTGYEFDHLADRYGFAVLYPDGYRGNWNDCRRTAPYPAKRANIDDVGFMRALLAQLSTETRIDTTRVYAFGYSNGGQLAFRLAIEQPQLVQAIATAGATLPTADNCACAADGPTARVLLALGTADPIVPYEGGEVTLFGCASRGRNLSALATATTFAHRNGLADSPLSTLPVAGGRTSAPLEHRVWQRGQQRVVELWTIPGGGHVVPQPAFRFPRIVGYTATDFDLPAYAVTFFGITLP